jgi:hypothetical protein
MVSLIFSKFMFFLFFLNFVFNTQNYGYNLWGMSGVSDAPAYWGAPEHIGARDPRVVPVCQKAVKVRDARSLQ